MVNMHARINRDPSGSGGREVIGRDLEMEEVMAAIVL
jgi:hypothetical protein